MSNKYFNRKRNTETIKDWQLIKSHHLLVYFSFCDLFHICNPRLAWKSLSLKASTKFCFYRQVKCTQGTQNNVYQLNPEIDEKKSQLEHGLMQFLNHKQHLLVCHAPLLVYEVASKKCLCTQSLEARGGEKTRYQ